MVEASPPLATKNRGHMIEPSQMELPAAAITVDEETLSTSPIRVLASSVAFDLHGILTRFRTTAHTLDRTLDMLQVRTNHTYTYCPRTC